MAMRKAHEGVVQLGKIGVTKHGVSRKIERGIKTVDELDALKNPLKVKDIIIDKKTGLPSQRFIGKKAETVINPDTSKIISTNPTSSKVVSRLMKETQ